MRITFMTDLGATYSIEIDPKMELENVMALLEAEVGVSTLYYLELTSFLSVRQVWHFPRRTKHFI